MELSILPAVNASLNAATAFFLVSGYILIRNKAVAAHKRVMLSACLTSALFLVSYLYYHAHHGMTRFQGQGFIRTVYFTILISHTILAVIIVPLVIITLVFALKGNFVRHKAIARVTLPLWLYVSITGVLVYWILYKLL